MASGGERIQKDGRPSPITIEDDLQVGLRLKDQHVPAAEDADANAQQVG